MTAAHTPGPWWVTETGIRDSGGYIAHTNSVQRYDGQDDRYVFEVAQREADKRLIAAAPDLLEALRDTLEALECWTGSDVRIGKARVAIAKATGATS